LVGTHAFRHYDLVLGVHLSDDTGWITQTDDIDIASFEQLSMAIEDTTDPDLGAALGKLGFKPAATLTPKTPTSWTLSDRSYAIDFLTPSFGKEEKPAKLAALDMWAQGLHYLNFLIKDPMPAVTPYMEGLLIQIPRPERYAVHKLIVSQKRRAGSETKQRKDIEQARMLIRAMDQTHAHELKSAIAEADAMGPKWRETLDRALAIKFSSAKPAQHPGQDGVQYEGFALGQPMRFGVSGTAFASFDNPEAARETVEAAIRKKFRAEPSHALMLMSYDL
jgi:hypothetical protein